MGDQTFMGIIGTSRPSPMKIKKPAKEVPTNKGLHAPRLELGSNQCFEAPAAFAASEGAAF